MTEYRIDGALQGAIYQCSYCRMDTVGNHEQSCPNNKRHSISGDTDFKLDNFKPIDSEPLIKDRRIDINTNIRRKYGNI